MSADRKDVRPAAMKRHDCVIRLVPVDADKHRHDRRQSDAVVENQLRQRRRRNDEVQRRDETRRGDVQLPQV